MDLHTIVATLSGWTWTFEPKSTAGTGYILPDRIAMIRMAPGGYCVWVEDENPWMIEWETVITPAGTIIRHVQGDLDVILRDVVMGAIQASA